MRASGLVALADDSGLEVQAIGGGPGVHSARFLGAEATFEQRFAEIERRLAGLPARAAHVSASSLWSR